MIYAGFLNFGSQEQKDEDLVKAVGFFTQSPPKILRKDSLLLCYGKLSNTHDMDKIWENESSILMGRAFDKTNSIPLDKKIFKDLEHVTKEEFLGRFWGKYLYLNTKEEKFDIVIDSTGQLPFFYYPFPNGNILFSSDIEIIFKILGQRPEYNWEYLCSYLVYGTGSAIQTPFKNIFELPPACCLRVTKKERKTSPFWNPLSSYNKPEEKEKNAVDVLKETLKPWIAPYNNIVVSLSGGLDSSSLMYCLKDILKEGQNLKAINYFHSQVKSSNELAHARKVCEETGTELIEIDASNSLPFDPHRKKQSLKPNKPFPGMNSKRWLEIIFDYLPSRDPFAFISGHGSDHIFMRPPSKKSTADYLLEKGIRGYKGQLENIAQFYRDPLYSILRENLKGVGSYLCAHLPKKRDIKNQLMPLPAWGKKELRDKTSSEFVHPIYMDFPKSVLPGKYEQIDSLYEGFASIHLEMTNQADPTYYPFLYEPVVEFALSFPTYELFGKGYDRYPLRKSVSEIFKTDTVWRRDKSQTTGLFQLGIKRNLNYVLDLCLEGHFVKQGLIDKEGLQRTINLLGNGDIKHLWPFMYLASAELFLRDWDEKPL